MTSASRGRDANDRTGFALVAPESCLRDVVAPALGSLTRPGGTHSVAAIVEELSREESVGGLACFLRYEGSTTIGKTSLDLIPQLLRHDRLVLALMDSALVGDPPDIDRFDRIL
jgi:hypothetical protein